VGQSSRRLVYISVAVVRVFWHDRRMRIFGWLFGGIAGVIAAVLLFWLVGERVVMLIASRQLESNIASIRQTATKGNSSGSCATSFVNGYQLRFVDDTTYVTETLCGDRSPGIILSTQVLVGGVKRLYGSGIKIAVPVTSVADTWVHLQYHSIIVAVGYFDGSISTNWQPQQLSIGGANPADALCANWGFTCCQSGMGIGSGYQVRTNDCTNACFQQCSQKPLILYFNSDPLMDQMTREVHIQAVSTKVLFGFEVVDYDDAVTQVQIDFGDQQTSDVVASKETAVTHTYLCQRQRCVYEARLRARDTYGNELADSTIQTIRVVMQP